MERRAIRAVADVRAGSVAAPARDRAAILVPIAIVLVLGLVRICFTRPIIEDEVAHLPQIERFVAGDYTLIPDLTTIPGYHATLALIAWAVGTHSLEAMRTVNVVLSAVCVGVLALLLRQLHGHLPGHRLIQLAFFPITFPYYFLVYTDVAALLLVATALLLALQNRHGWAALLASAGILVRQTDVVWLAMIPILALVVDGVVAWRTSVRSWVGYALGLVAFAAFVCWNGGVALGDRASHPAFTIHLANVFFFLALYAVFLLPGIVARLPRTLAFLRDQPAAVVALAGVLVLYFFASDTDHPYNNFAPDYFLRNGILMAVRASPLLKAIGVVPIGLAAMDLLAGAVRRPTLAVVATFTVLVLVPSWLVEQRYDIIPFALLLAVAPEESPRVETITSVACVAVSLVFVYGIQNGLFFL